MPTQNSLYPAGQELLLECVTKDLGWPRASNWIWYRNGQPLDMSSSSQVAGGKLEDNIVTNHLQEVLGVDHLASHNDIPITSSRQLSTLVANQQPQPDSSRTSIIAPSAGGSTSWRGQSSLPAKPSTESANEINSTIANLRPINSGRYLFIQSLQLAHKASYSCVAVNRLGVADLRDSHQCQVEVALAPSFIQPLPERTFWPEVTPLMDEDGNEAGHHNKLSAGTSPTHLELVCHVQCEPICQIEWFRNNESLENKRQTDSFSSNFVTYQVRSTTQDENVKENLFKSVESRLIIQFVQPGSVTSNALGSIDKIATTSDANIFSNSQRDKILERRRILNEANYTCQSTKNSIGPSVRSTTKFIVQCEYFIGLPFTSSRPRLNILFMVHDVYEETLTLGHLEFLRTRGSLALRLPAIFSPPTNDC